MIENGGIAELEFKGSVMVADENIKRCDVFIEAVGIDVGGIIRILRAVDDDWSRWFFWWASDFIWLVEDGECVFQGNGLIRGDDEQGIEWS